jgi:phosphoesterase RecJ-like protein
LPLQIKGIILSCFLREDTEQGLVKVSLRSVGNFSCTTIAEQYFNGGGHLNASGGELKGTMEEAITRWEEVLDIIRPSLKAGDNTENNENNNHKNKEQ